MKPLDGIIRPGDLALTKQLAEFCAFPAKSRVVDVGCGTGITVEYLRDSWNLQTVGVDSSATRLQRGYNRSPELPLIQATGEELPFASCSVDGVFAECSLSVMQDVNRVLAEVQRILVPQGKLALSDLYVRQADDGLAVNNDSWVGSSCGVMTEKILQQRLAKHGFKTLIWEDRSACLKEYVACFIMEHGSLEALCHDLPTIKSAKLGYFWLVAEKSAVV